MRPLVAIAIVSGFLASAIPASAETRAGLGFSVGTTTVLSGGSTPVLNLTDISFPIVSEALKFEPQFGLYRVTQKQGSDEFSATNFRLGASLGAGHMGEELAGWFGVTGGFIRSSASYDGVGAPDDDSKWDWYVGPFGSAEYFFNRHLSVAGKVGLVWTFPGDPIGETGTTPDVTIMSTVNNLSLAFYF
jgi:hypothetical protein